MEHERYSCRKPELYVERKDCCGCGACMNICPQGAIHMAEDACGFLYPQIEDAICIECGSCQTVCAFQNVEETNIPIETYAAVSRNPVEARKSASGGIFAALASQVIEQGGVVFGAAFAEDWSVHQIAVDSKERLYRLQGSKYTQSCTEDTFRQTKKFLQSGRKVLYSGTPCQIAGLRALLDRDYAGLFTVDLVCHGVPSNRMLKDYISCLEKKDGGQATAFTFRNKEIGWGENGQVEFSRDNHAVKRKILWQSASSYLYYFSQAWIYRESCYICKYASARRPADLTLGDYWGIEKAHPDYLGKRGWDEQNGISVVIANTDKGLHWLEQAGGIELLPSSFALASKKNARLRQPSSPGIRKEIIAIYNKGGWAALEIHYRQKIGWRKYSSQIKAVIPKALKRRLKRLSPNSQRYRDKVARGV